MAPQASIGIGGQKFRTPIMRACLETHKLEQLEARTFTHRYVIEAPRQLSREEWEKKYSLPAPAEMKCDRTPSDESLVLSNE